MIIYAGIMENISCLLSERTCTGVVTGFSHVSHQRMKWVHEVSCLDEIASTSISGLVFKPDETGALSLIMNDFDVELPELSRTPRYVIIHYDGILVAKLDLPTKPAERVRHVFVTLPGAVNGRYGRLASFVLQDE